MYYAFLSQRGLIRLSGEDAVAFLQGLVSNDVTRLAQAGALYAVLLTPQGKFLHDFFLMAEGDAILIDCEKARVADLVQRLKMYKLRSKVAIDVVTDKEVAAVWGGVAPASADVLVYRDPRLESLGWRLVGAREAIVSWTQGMAAADYDRMRLDVGVPDGSADMIVDKSFPLPFGLEDLQAVDFKKGCYVGQEVTARTKHLGQLRKFLYKVKSDGALPPPGASIYLSEQLAGEMRSGNGQVGLALLSVEMVEKAHSAGMRLQWGEVALDVSLPEWVRHVPSAA